MWLALSPRSCFASRVFANVPTKNNTNPKVSTGGAKTVVLAFGKFGVFLGGIKMQGACKKCNVFFFHPPNLTQIGSKKKKKTNMWRDRRMDGRTKNAGQ